MSRPSSWYDDSLPQFSSSSIRQLPPAPYHPSTGSPSNYHSPPPPTSSSHGPPPPPPPSGSSYNAPSSPYRSDPNRTTSMYAPQQPQQQQQQTRPSTLYGGSQSTGGPAAGLDLDHLLPSHTASNSINNSNSSSSSAFSLARSASLGGPRRKDPFGNHIDDVERALGSEERGGPAGGWSDAAQINNQYSNSLQGAFGGAGFSRGAGGGGVGDLYQGGGGGMMGGLEGGVGHDRSSGLMSVSMLSSSSSQQGISSRGGQDQGGARTNNLMGPPPSANSSSNRTQPMGPPPPPPQPQQPSSSSSSSSSYQPQQHYSLGQPPPPSQNPYIPQQQQQHHPSGSSSSAYDPSNSNVGGGGHSPSSGGPSSSSTNNWSSSYSPLPSPHVDMRTSPLPRPPPLPQHSLSYTASSSSSKPPPSPSSHLQQQQQYQQQQQLASSSNPTSYQQQQHPSNPYAPPPQQHQQHPQPFQPPPHAAQPYSSQPPSSASYASSSASAAASPYAPQQSQPSSSYSSPQTQTDSLSTPGYARGTPSPTNYGGGGGSNASQLYPREVGGMEGPPKAKAGFKKVRDLRDVKPVFSGNGGGGGTSPLTSLTSQLALTYSSCNPQFRYEVAHNPRRVLTKPSKGVLNDGHDNEENDYILYVNDWLGTEEGHKYLILDVLGQGTFGQVVKCQNMKTNEVVAVKVIKNKPAYFNQSMMEVAILDELNTKCDPHDTHNILRMRTHFIHCKHLCLVFECLSSNLYELIKQNSFRGLSTQLVKVFTTQLLDTLTVLHEARLIHCDLKPENILLKSLQSPHIKVIDFGSACHEYSTVYTYIQSRFYRSPEVLLGLPYSTAIDMWSLGCIAVELFLGLPLFPGTSEYNQLSRIIEMLGLPPNHLLENGKQVHEFFVSEPNPEPYGRGGRVFRLKSMEQYSKEHNTSEQPSKQYFKASTLPEIIKTYAFAKKGAKPSDIDKEMAIRASFTDFVLGLLNLDPIKRWSPQQAMLHPFITGEKFTGPFDPRRAQSAHQSESMQQQQQQQHAPPPQSQQQPVDPKRPYGGLVVNTASRTPRAYQDAATYNQQLAHHQTYTAQQQAAQAAASAYRHPFAPADDSSAASYNQQQQQQRAYQSQQAQAQQQLHLSQQQQQQHQRVSGGSASSGLIPSSYSVRNSTGAILPPPAAAHPSNPPSNAYFPSAGRNRANTIGQMDVVPPQLARIANLGVEQSQGGRSALTPVMNREEMMREWERRNAQGASGKRASVNQTTWPQLEFLEGQAESLGWGPSSNARYSGGGGGGGGIQFPPPPMTVIVDDGSSSRSRQLHQHQRDHSMSRDVSMGGGPGDGGRSSDPSNRYDPSPSPNSIPQAPPQAYSIGNQNNARYSASYQQPPPLLSSNNSSSNSGYDAYDPHRDGLGTLIQPLIPAQQQGVSSSFGPSSSSRSYANLSTNGGQQQQQQQRNNPFVGGGGGSSTSPNSPNANQSSFGFMSSPQQQQLLQKKKSAGALEGWR